MPSTTAAPTSLPYPVPADPNDVPADILALANRLQAILAPGSDVEAGPRLRDYSESLATQVDSDGAVTIDAAVANVHDVTIGANTTFTFTNPPPTGRAGTLTLIARQDATGGRVATWPASVRWPGGNPVALSTAANAVDVFTFLTVDGGTTWLAFVGGLAFA